MKAKTANFNYLIVILALAFLLLTSCKKEEANEMVFNETVKDIDGNVYQTVTIGNQIWMVENLRVTRYRNGDPILHLADSTDWWTTKQGAFCYYDNDDRYNILYGKLYNGLAIRDNRNIAPVGYHIPSVAELGELISFVGGCIAGASSLKSEGSEYWQNDVSNPLGIVQIGFKALPGGCRSQSKLDSLIFAMGLCGTWWTNTVLSSNANMSWGLPIFNNSEAAKFRTFHKCFGLSVRCIKDTPIQ